MFESNMLRKIDETVKVKELRIARGGGASVTRPVLLHPTCACTNPRILPLVAHPDQESYWHVIARTCGIPGCNYTWFLVLCDFISSSCPTVRLYY